MKRYKVITGIFAGREFKGELSTNGKTVWDMDSIGLGYPIKNCIKLSSEPDKVVATLEQIEEWRKLNEEDLRLYEKERKE